MQVTHSEYVSASWGAVTVQMVGCHCGYIAHLDPSLIHAYQKRT